MTWCSICCLTWIDPLARRAERWIGELHEPGGIACANGTVYVADADAHRVLVIDDATAEVMELVMSQ